MYIEQLPIPVVSAAEQLPVTTLVGSILANPHSSDVPRLEAEIDRLVYDLYGLTQSEIEIIEKK
jgi:hypothetical protein